MKKLTIAALAAASILALAVPAAADTFTSPNGIMSMELPNDGWKEMADPTRWVALSDGANLITVDHFANGEKLPEMSVADNHYVNVYQAVYSTQNEVFIITGSVVDAAKIPEVCNTILSAKVLQYDTKLAVKKDEQAKVSDFSLAAMNETMYASANVNVRSGCSTNDQILGVLNKGASIQVKGRVQKDGKDFGWYQIDFGGKTGYVSAEFVSKTAPAADAAASKSQDASRQLTGNVKTIYREDGSLTVTIYEATDNCWYDSTNKKYTQTTDYEFVAENGDIFMINRPQDASVNAPVADSFTAYWENSNTTKLTQYSDGFFYSSEGVRYTDNHDGSFSGADGTTLYDYDPISGSPDDVELVDDEIGDDADTTTHKFISQETGEAVLVDEAGASFYDEEGMEYTATGEGDYVDEEGEEFDMEW